MGRISDFGPLSSGSISDLVYFGFFLLNEKGALLSQNTLIIFIPISYWNFRYTNWFNSAF